MSQGPAPGDKRSTGGQTVVQTKRKKQVSAFLKGISEISEVVAPEDKFRRMQTTARKG